MDTGEPALPQLWDLAAEVDAEENEELLGVLDDALAHRAHDLTLAARLRGCRDEEVRVACADGSVLTGRPDVVTDEAMALRSPERTWCVWLAGLAWVEAGGTGASPPRGRDRGSVGTVLRSWVGRDVTVGFRNGGTRGGVLAALGRDHLELAPPGRAAAGWIPHTAVAWVSPTPG